VTTDMPDSSAEADRDQDAWAAALTRLPGMGPATLVSILREHEPREAWELVCEGRLRRRSRADGVSESLSLFGAGDLLGGEGGDVRSWAKAASRIEVTGWWDRAAGRGVQVTWFGRVDYPEALVRDPNPPGVLFWRGSLSCLTSPRVAIVGTRNATPDGRAIAFEMGRDLTEAGVCVVSGLALGIDGAAHHGALEGLAHEDAAGSARPSAPPIGVAASGVDVPYPKQHASLWERVCQAGAVISETPPGQPAQAWRFPTRNRIIAGLSLMVVVVESHSKGGSLITAEAALERGVEVRVVPGPVRSPASEGSNQLLYDGPGPVRCARDVLDALGVLLPDDSGASSAKAGSRGDPDAQSSEERAAVEAVGWRPSSLGQVVERSGLAVGRAATILDALEARGVLGREGAWWVRVPLGDRA
jgi:DNA processing protein